MRRVWILVTMIAVSISVCNAQFFPKSSLDHRGDNFKAQWYSSQLRALEEPSLFKSADNRLSHSYRFLWLRTFNHPIAIRMDVKADGTGVLTMKKTSGAGGYAPGKLIMNSTRILDSNETKAFLSLVDKTGFWTAPNPVDDQTGTDGSQWIIEGAKNGTYRVVDRWMPKSGVAHDLGMFLVFNLAKMNVPQKEVY